MTYQRSSAVRKARRLNDGALVALALAGCIAASILIYMVGTAILTHVANGISDEVVFTAAKVASVEHVEVLSRENLTDGLGVWRGCDMNDYVKFSATGTNVYGETVNFWVCVDADGSGTIHF
jgi:hypothetical protein